MDIKFIETEKNPANFEHITPATTLLSFKQSHGVGKAVYLSKKFLQITHCLYGKSKDETIKIWRSNCKSVRKAYKFMIKIIKWLKRNDPKFVGTFFVNTKDKLNNNDFMLEQMLDLKFKKAHFFRLTKSLEVACDFLNKENTLNNMCDFKDNICVNYRVKDPQRDVGCCSKKCKFCSKKACEQKNISCKLFMCDTVVEKGFYFNPYSLPILRQNLSLLDRMATHAVLFRSTKSCYKVAWYVRIMTCIVLFAIILFPFVKLIKFLIGLF